MVAKSTTPRFTRDWDKQFATTANQFQAQPVTIVSLLLVTVSLLLVTIFVCPHTSVSCVCVLPAIQAFSGTTLQASRDAKEPFLTLQSLADDPPIGCGQDLLWFLDALADVVLGTWA